MWDVGYWLGNGGWLFGGGGRRRYVVQEKSNQPFQCFVKNQKFYQQIESKGKKYISDYFILTKDILAIFCEKLKIRKNNCFFEDYLIYDVCSCYGDSGNFLEVSAIYDMKKIIERISSVFVSNQK